ncbi:hypothetical protein STEG23_033476 [Scotinomys teguina]
MGMVVVQRPDERFHGQLGGPNRLAQHLHLVCGASGLWGIWSVGHLVCGASGLWGIWSVGQSFLGVQRTQRGQVPPQIKSVSVSLLSMLEFPLPYTAGSVEFEPTEFLAFSVYSRARDWLAAGDPASGTAASGISTTVRMD